MKRKLQTGRIKLERHEHVANIESSEVYGTSFLVN